MGGFRLDNKAAIDEITGCRVMPLGEWETLLEDMKVYNVEEDVKTHRFSRDPVN